MILWKASVSVSAFCKYQGIGQKLSIIIGLNFGIGTSLEAIPFTAILIFHAFSTSYKIETKIRNLNENIFFDAFML